MFRQVKIGTSRRGCGWSVYSMDLASSLPPKCIVMFSDTKVQLNIVWGLQPVLQFLYASKMCSDVSNT